VGLLSRKVDQLSKLAFIKIHHILSSLIIFKNVVSAMNSNVTTEILPFTSHEIRELTINRKKNRIEEMSNAWIAIVLDRERVASTIDRFYANQDSGRMYLIIHNVMDRLLSHADHTNILIGVKHDSLGQKSIIEYLEHLLPQGEDKQPICWDFGFDGSWWDNSMKDGDFIIDKFVVFLRYKHLPWFECTLL
jgi:hypothetical protein